MKKIFLFLAVLSFSHVTAQQWKWAVSCGGSSREYPQSVFVDDNYVYVTGLFEGTSTFGDTTITSAGGEDVFIAKYDNLGNFIWVVREGGIEDEEGWGITADTFGNVIVSGTYLRDAIIGGVSLNNTGYSAIYPDVFHCQI